MYLGSAKTIVDFLPKIYCKTLKIVKLFLTKNFLKEDYPKEED